MKKLKGIPISPGYASGRLKIFPDDEIHEEIINFSNFDSSAELEKFKKCVEDSKKEILQIKGKVAASIGPKEAEIFQAQYLMLEDPALIDETEKLIVEEKLTAVQAFLKAAGAIENTLLLLEDETLRSRASDVKDVKNQLLNHLKEKSFFDEFKIIEPSILVARELLPSRTATLDRKNILAIATEKGGPSSHAAILARAMGVPAVAGIQGIFHEAGGSAMAIVDGAAGLLILDPDEVTVDEYFNMRSSPLPSPRRGEDKGEGVIARIGAKQAGIVLTKSGKEIEIFANASTADDACRAMELGAAGIGLLRTEMLFMHLPSMPDEEVQLEGYKNILKCAGKKKVTARLFDFGGDKTPLYLAPLEETNPALGARGIRYLLYKKDILETQLRALLRASVYGNLRIMIPMVTVIEEIIEVKNTVEKLKNDLKSSGIPNLTDIPLGIMIETPASALNSILLAGASDFFSIGTNDLIQYTMAADRDNEFSLKLYQPSNPAVLKLIKMAVEAAESAKIEISVCGEMAGEFDSIPLLLGIGIMKLSMNPSNIPGARALIERLEG